MSITGGIKFFDLNLADSEAGSTVVASSGQPSADFIIDKNKYTVWRSVGSSDITTEVLSISFPSLTISRLFLLTHNFKSFIISYWTGSGYAAIPNVTGINGVQSASAQETDYAFNSSYYEFSPITTINILISATLTQTPNQEKFLNSFVVGNELGTLAGFPAVRVAEKNKNLRKSRLLDGKQKVTKSLETMKFSIDFKNYPTLETYHPDLDLVYSLFDRDENFLTWICGGRTGAPYYNYNLRGFRIEDLIETQVTNKFKDSYKDNLYPGVAKLGMILEEAG